MAAPGANAAKAVAGILAAAALAVPAIHGFEGWKNKGYKDPAPGAFETICAGHYQPGVLGKTYTDEQCAGLLAQDAVRAGLDIAPCLPPELPTETRAAFISLAFNIGGGAFCKSSVARKAIAGDLRGACEAMSLYVKSGGVVLPGLVARRKAERELCLKGLP